MMSCARKHAFFQTKNRQNKTKKYTNIRQVSKQKKKI